MIRKEGWWREGWMMIRKEGWWTRRVDDDQEGRVMVKKGG